MRTQLQEDSGFTAEQFETPDVPIPWNAIGLATLLFSVGSLLIVLGVMIKLGYILSDVWLDRGTPFLIIGCIMFIPGAYHMYLAYYAYYKYPGYDFNMIPDWD
ncbi:Zgc:162251 protein [Spinellus fusiger]|nr:Zgc:162251 protein [Spinellus fusiger]